MPATKVRPAPSGAVKTLNQVQVRDAGNVLRDIFSIWVRDSTNTPRLVFSRASTLAVTGGGSAYGQTSSQSAAKFTQTPTVQLTVSGGKPPYTYAWSRTSPAAFVPITCDAPTANPTTFSATLNPGYYVQEDWKCVITDADGSTVTLNPPYGINVTLQCVSLL